MLIIARLLLVLSLLLWLSPLHAQHRGTGNPLPSRSSATDGDDGNRLIPLDLVTSGHCIARFSTPLTGKHRERVERAGLRLLGITDDNQWVVSVGNRLDTQRLQALGCLGFSQRTVASKLHALLTTPFAPEFLDRGHGNAVVQLVGYADVPRAELRRAAEAHEGRVVGNGALTLPILVVELPWIQIPRLAAEDVVMWLEPPTPALTATNDTNRAVSGVDVVQGRPYELEGAGVSVMVYDTGLILASHVDFGSRVTQRDSTIIRNHSTHVAGTIGGSGQASGGQYRGMAPSVLLESYGVELDGAGAFFHTDTADLEEDFADALQHGVVVANASVGSNVSGNLLPCGLLGDYGASSALIDGFVTGSLGSPLAIVWAAGNERGSPNCGTSYATIGPPSANKNAIVVGSIDADTGQATFSTSWGPTDDGRIKPDVCAPGCQTTGDGGVTSTAANGAYDTLCGTSMAAPTVTGIVALLIEDHRIQYPATADPLSSTLKVLLAHTAVDAATLGPDYETGYGEVRADDALNMQQGGQFVEQQVDQGESYSFEINVPATTPQLKVTVAWDDVAALPFVTNTLVNDLDLIVTSPSGVRAYPWTLDPANPANSAVRTQEDHLNNIEQVLVDNPQSGVWQVQIVGTSVPLGPQSFSVCADGEMRAVAFMLSEPIPQQIEPASLQRFVTVRGINQTVTSTPELMYRLNGGPFQALALTDLGGGIYQVALPAPACGHSPEYYFRATASVTGAETLPAAGAAAAFAPSVQFFVPVLVDDFENDLGWTVGAPTDTATTGVWQRVNPVGTPAAPEDDVSDPGTQCFVTGQGVVGGAAGDNDVDGGTTTLLSPVFDLGSIDAQVSYWYWYSNALTLDNPVDDVLRFEISNDGGMTWEVTAEVGPGGPGNIPGWNFVTYRVTDYLLPTSTMRVRITAEDSGNPHLVEAAIDDFFVEQLGCSACFLRADVNEDNSTNITDATALLLYLFAGGTPPTILSAADADGGGTANLLDVIYILDYLFTQGPPPPAPFPVFGCL